MGCAFGRRRTEQDQDDQDDRQIQVQDETREVDVYSEVEDVHDKMNGSNTTALVDLTGYSWLPPVCPYEIYYNDVKGKPLYLCIDGMNDLVFMPYNNRQQSFFCRYNYISGNPAGNGNVRAFSQQRCNTPITPNTTFAVNSSKRKKVNLVLTDFPDSMKGDNLALNVRFWYQKYFQNGYSLESVIQRGNYLSYQKGSTKAVLSNNPTELYIQPHDNTEICGN